MCMAAPRLSPVSIAVFRPNSFNSLIASGTPVRQVSDRLKIPIGVAPENMYPAVIPSFFPSKLGTENLGSRLDSKSITPFKVNDNDDDYLKWERKDM